MFPSRSTPDLQRETRVNLVRCCWDGALRILSSVLLCLITLSVFYFWIDSPNHEDCSPGSAASVLMVFPASESRLHICLASRQHTTGGRCRRDSAAGTVGP
eukprot:2457305-Rhodomonas_salina.2